MSEILYLNELQQIRGERGLGNLFFGDYQEIKIFHYIAALDCLDLKSNMGRIRCVPVLGQLLRIGKGFIHTRHDTEIKIFAVIEGGDYYLIH